MRLSSFILVCVSVLLPGSTTGSRFDRLPRIFDYKYYLFHNQKSYEPTSDSFRNKLFLGRSLEIFKHNYLFLLHKTNYYLQQSAMTDLTREELSARQGQNPDLDLKPVQEARDYGDLPASYLESIQELANDVASGQTDDDQPVEEQNVRFIGSRNNPEDMEESLNKMNQNYMSPETFESKRSKQVRLDLQRHLNNMQEDYMTLEASDKRAGQNVAGPKIPDGPAHDKSLDQIMSSFSNSINELLDDPMDEVVSSFSDSVNKLLEGAKEGDELEVNDVMHPKVSSGSVTKYKIDWRITNCIGRPKAQEACNACYIFATLDLLEYFYCRQMEDKASFSSQHVLDCGRELGLINGCQGGRMSEVGQFISDYGLRYDSDYPYTGVQGKCRSLEPTGGNAVKPEIINWQLFNSITAWYKWARQSPILVGINMPADFHVYGGGIHDGLNCNINETHAMLLVGSGSQDGIEFWLLKNSFSEDWGEKGYFRVSTSALLNCFGSAIVARATFSQ